MIRICCKSAIASIVSLAFVDAKAADLMLVPEPSNQSFAAVATSMEVRQALVTAVETFLDLPQGSDLSYMRTSLDVSGQRHVRFSRTLNGYPVVGTQVLAHLDDTGRLVEVSVADMFSSGVASSPSITEEVALASAIAHANGESSVPASALSTPELCYFYDAPSGAVFFVYSVKVAALIEGVPSKREYFISCDSGVVVEFHEKVVAGLYRQISDANGASTYGAVVRSEGSAPVYQLVVDSAYDNWGYFYDYFNNRYGRDSYDGAGSALRVTVNRGGLDSFNAFWDKEAKRWGLG